jgi:hypothetical protein
MGMQEQDQMTAQPRPAGVRGWPWLHRHQWELVDQIGWVCTYQCPCGKSKTRIRDADGQPLPDQSLPDQSLPDQSMPDQPAA